MSRVAILQSNYIPWKGYFDIINSVDFFVLYDDVQYTKNDWRNRNKIKTPHGELWLTIPVKRNSLNQSINETETANALWRKKHWQSILQSYGKSRYFGKYRETFESLYLESDDILLSEINRKFIRTINNILGIKTKLIDSREFNNLSEDRNERLLQICKKLNAKRYISGRAAQDYLNVEMFHDAGIGVEWMVYSNYPEYSQLHDGFVHEVSVIDLIFNEGEMSSKYMLSFNRDK